MVDGILPVPEHEPKYRRYCKPGNDDEGYRITGLHHIALRKYERRYTQKNETPGVDGPEGIQEMTYRKTVPIEKEDQYGDDTEDHYEAGEDLQDECVEFVLLRLTVPTDNWDPSGDIAGT